LTGTIWQRIVEKDLVFLLLVALLLRLVITPLLFDDYNYWAFGVFTSFLLHGQNPYHVVSQDPTLLFINIWRYPPLYLLFTAPAVLIRQLTGNPLLYLGMLKLPFAFADTVSTYYIYKILRRYTSEGQSLKFAAFYAFNPIVIFESAGGGFSDPIPIALTVASFYYFVKASDSVDAGKEVSKSALLMGLGIAAKIYPLLLVPVLVRALNGNRRRIQYLFLSALPPAVMSVPFLYWDWQSYLGILALRNVGGQHPLFPGFEFSGIIAVPFAAALVASLLFIYLRKLPVTSGIVLVFLWVNIAVFAQSFNYLVWGVPFFTLFVAINRRWYWMPLSPLFTMLVALVFQGSYNNVGGSTGVFYWTFHLFQLQIVAFYEPLVFAGLLVGVLFAGYYFVRVVRFDAERIRGSTEVPRLLRRFTPGLRHRRLFPALLCLTVMLSWGVVAEWSNFLPHKYPALEGTTFAFGDNFHAALLDYQWLFLGNGTYKIDPALGSIKMIDANNGTASIRRGWAGVTDGFHISYSADVHFLFRMDNLALGSNGMTLANMTDGQLAVRGGANGNFVYLDELNQNTVITLSTANGIWHNFTIGYHAVGRTITLDGTEWTLPGGSFSKLILGNSDSRPGFHGSAEFGDVLVREYDFPAGYQSTFAGWAAVVLPAVLIALMFLPLYPGVMNSLKVAWRRAILTAHRKSETSRP
jgi:hypothetical protein